MEGYCVDCKVKKEISEAKEIILKNNKRTAIKGKCPTCGSNMLRIMGKK